MTASPELETPVRQGSRFRGILGAFLGAVLWSCLSGLLMFLFVDELAIFILWGNVLLAGWIASWGYRLLKGYRSMKFAQWTVRISIVLAQPLVAVTRLISFKIWPFFRSGIPISWKAVEEIVLQVVEALQKQGALVAIGGMVFPALLFAKLGWGVLLKYIDPDWYNDPRRLARIGGGGATFNMAPCWPLPANENIPERFEVDKGKLAVEGDTITVREKRKAQRSFSVKEIAGVVLGVSTGYNILYDKENRMLARFAWSRKNALVFGQYLVQRQVPFVDVNGSPVPTTPEAPEYQAVPRQFTVREEKLCLGLGWFGVIFFGGMLIADLFFLDGLTRLVCGAVFLFFVVMFIWTLLAYYNRRLEVDGEEVSYTTSLGKTTRFRLSDIAEIRVSLDGWKVKDREGKREGKTLARFASNMNGAELLLACWNRSKQERNGIL